MSLFLPCSLPEFAERVIIPSGPVVGARYSHDKNPLSWHILRALDDFLNNRGGREFYLISGNQVGKSLCGLLSVLYVALELREDVIIFGPTIDLANAVLSEVNRSMTLMGLEPKRANIRFMETHVGTKVWSRGQSDSQRSQATARYVWVTEAEKIHKKRTEESDPIDQIRARTLAYPNGKIFFESTLATGTGPMWSAYLSDNYKCYEFKQRCPECNSLFVPDLQHVQPDGYPCEVCGVFIDQSTRKSAIRNGCFVCTRDIGLHGVVYRATSLDSFLVPSALSEICALRDSNSMEQKRRLQLQFIAQPPQELHVFPDPPQHIDRHRGTVDKDEVWSIGVDIRREGAYFVLLTCNRGSGTIFISDFGSIKGNFEEIAEKLEKYRQSHCREEQGLIVYDYGYHGGNVTSAFTKHGTPGTFMPIRGINDLRFTQGVGDVRYADIWRLKQMKPTGTCSLQFAATAGKDRVRYGMFGGAYMLFGIDYLKSETELELFLNSVLRSEVPQQQNGKRVYFKVREHNHFFDCVVYATIALSFLAGVIPNQGSDVPEDVIIEQVKEIDDARDNYINSITLPDAEIRSQFKDPISAVQKKHIKFTRRNDSIL